MLGQYPRGMRLADDLNRAVPELVEVNVSHYKNLEEVHLSWSTGVVLFGPNGSGKSNLLEALTLLFGTRQSLELFNWAAMPPIDPDGWGLSAVLTNDLAATRTSGRLSRSLAEWAPLRDQFGSRFQDEHTWWQNTDPKWSDSVRTWVDSIELPVKVRAVIEKALDGSAVKYTLEALTPDGPTTSLRRFSRVLMIHKDELAGLDRSSLQNLPPVFSPLSQKTNRRSEWAPVMSLPDSPFAPTSLQYIPRIRTPAERRYDFDSAIGEASAGVERLIESLDESDLFTTVRPLASEANWWLQRRGARAATRELAAIFPSLEINTRAFFYPGVDLEVVATNSNHRMDRPIDLLFTDEELGEAKKDGALDADLQNLESGLSSAQRRWVDEALAVAAENLRAFGQQAALWAYGLTNTEFDDLFTLLMPDFDAIEAQLRENDYWTAELLDRVVDILGERLDRTVESKISSYPSDERDLFRWIAVPRGKEPGPSMIRCVDEPEAHLDAITQRRVASRLLSLQRTGNHVAVASHSAVFLGLPDFTLVRAKVGKNRTLFSTPTLKDAETRRAIAKEMGLGQGELLTGISSILIVEGAHDRIMMEAFANLNEHGMRILRMHGTDDTELFATASLDFIDEYLDVPIAILLDHVRIDKVNRAISTDNLGGLSKEERKLVQLTLSAQDAGREFKSFGLDHADVAMYLSETVVKEHSTNFTTWDDVDRRYKREDPEARPKFKTWLRQSLRLDITSETVRTMATEMRQRSLPPEDDFPRVTDLIEAWAASKHQPE